MRNLCATKGSRKTAPVRLSGGDVRILLQVADNADQSPNHIDETVDRFPVLYPKRWIHHQQLRLGQKCRQRVVEPVLNFRRQLLQRDRLLLPNCVRMLVSAAHALTPCTEGGYLKLTMNAPGIDPAAALADAVAVYRETANLTALLGMVDEIAAVSDTDTLIAIAEPYRDLVEVTGPIYERVVERRPDDARGLVILANCYWLAGRGPDVVAELAARAIAADPAARSAWHLWALAEADLRTRVSRWGQVVTRFPDDELARVNLADNAASLASTDHDERALVLAIDTYRELRAVASRPDQVAALDRAIAVLESWEV